MKKLIIVSMMVVTLFGCANVKLKTSKSYISNDETKISITINKGLGVSITEDQYQLLENQITEGLAKKGILASNEKVSQHSAVVSLHSFKLRDDAARLLVGILAGCDKIDSTVSVTDKSTRNEIGSSSISIKECAAWGVAEKVIKKYADGIVSFLSTKNALGAKKQPNYYVQPNSVEGSEPTASRVIQTQTSKQKNDVDDKIRENKQYKKKSTLIACQKEHAHLFFACQ